LLLYYYPLNENVFFSLTGFYYIYNMNNTYMEFTSYSAIKGYHMLSGVDYYFGEDGINYDYDNDIRNEIYTQPEGIVRFLLDGKIYEAYYDPDDGYRSSMTALVEIDAKHAKCPIRNVFPPQPVYVRVMNEDPHEDNKYNHFNVKEKYLSLDISESDERDGEFICIYNLESEEFPESNLILKVGTNHDDSYYPYAVYEYHPENLPINRKKVEK